MDLAVGGTFTKEDYGEYCNGLMEQINQLKADSAELAFSVDDINGCVNYCRSFLLNIPMAWEKADIDLKQRFQNFIFPQGLEYSHGKFRTAVTALIFNVLSEKKADLSPLASPRGFEPLLPP